MPLDFDSPNEESMDDYFRKEWVRGLFELSLENLRTECEGTGKAVHFRLFERYDLADDGAARTTYQQLATEFGIPVTSVTNYLAAMRRDFRRITLDKLKEITASDEEFRSEARQIIGTMGTRGIKK